MYYDVSIEYCSNKRIILLLYLKVVEGVWWLPFVSRIPCVNSLPCANSDSNSLRISLRKFAAKTTKRGNSYFCTNSLDYMGCLQIYDTLRDNLRGREKLTLLFSFLSFSVMENPLIKSRKVWDWRSSAFSTSACKYSSSITRLDSTVSLLSAPTKCFFGRSSKSLSGNSFFIWKKNKYFANQHTGVLITYIFVELIEVAITFKYNSALFGDVVSNFDVVNLKNY